METATRVRSAAKFEKVPSTNSQPLQYAKLPNQKHQFFKYILHIETYIGPHILAHSFSSISSSLWSQFLSTYSSTCSPELVGWGGEQRWHWFPGRCHRRVSKCLRWHPPPCRGLLQNKVESDLKKQKTFWIKFFKYLPSFRCLLLPWLILSMLELVVLGCPTGDKIDKFASWWWFNEFIYDNVGTLRKTVMWKDFQFSSYLLLLARRLPPQTGKCRNLSKMLKFENCWFWVEFSSLADSLCW